MMTIKKFQILTSYFIKTELIPVSWKFSTATVVENDFNNPWTINKLSLIFLENNTGFLSLSQNPAMLVAI